MSSTAVESYREREDGLRNILHNKLAASRRSLQEDKRKRKALQRQQSSLLKRKRDKELSKWYAENGLTARGFVRKHTPVIFRDLPQNIIFEKHAFFHKIPHVAFRASVEHTLLDELRAIEKDVREISKTSSVDPTLHRYGANKGYNLGLSVAPGFPHGDKEKGISGSVQWAEIVKSRPQLRNALISCLTQILHKAYGDQAWFQRLLHLTTKLNTDTGETRTIPSLPISGIWLTQNPKEEGVHCDKNVVGATFLLTTSSAEGAQLVMRTPTGKVIKHRLTPGHILAGSWANHAHCNCKVKKAEFRTSWTLYLDFRVFCSRYIYAESKGFSR